jgi:hypothetical protein
MSAVLAAALVAGAAAGCDKKEPTKTDVPKPPAPDVTPKATAGAASTGSATSTAGGAGGATIKSPAAPTTQAAAGSATKPAITGDAPLVTSTASAKHGKEAQDLLDKAMLALKENRFDDCKAALDKVDAMGDDVPRETREITKTTRNTLNQAQKLQKAPELPAGDEPNK